MTRKGRDGKSGPVRDWNVVVTIRGHEFARARKILRALGAVGRTRFYNVLVMKVDDGRDLLEVLRTLIASDPPILDVLARVVPLSQAFRFSTVADFERRGGEAILERADEMADRSFHVRIHRRGLKGDIVSPEEERRFDQLILDEEQRHGHPARVDFTDPDVIVAVETVGTRAGVSAWTRADRQRHPLLGLS